MQRVMDGIDVSANLMLIDDLCTTMTKGSLCAMGGLTPMPVQSAIKHWPEDFDVELVEQEIS
jgi:formate dehydrogenase iron-sulfur subunit